MTSPSRVQLRVYDISKGLAPSLSPMLLGKRIDGIFHTGIVLFGNEYFYGGGIICMPADQFEREYDLKPMREITLGETRVAKEDFHRQLSGWTSRFTEATYNILHWNCNHFTNECAKYLLEGQEIPKEYLAQHEEIMGTPMGQMILNWLQTAQQQMQAHMQQSGASSLFTVGQSRHQIPPQPTSDGGSLASSPSDVTTPTPGESTAVDPRDAQFFSSLKKLGKLKSGNDTASSGDAVALDALRLLSRLAGNLLAKPTDEKFRCVKKSNTAVGRALGVHGAAKCLIRLGFEEKTQKGEYGLDEQVYTFPSPTAHLLHQLRRRKLLVDQEISKITGEPISVGARSPSPAVSAPLTTGTAPSPSFPLNQPGSGNGQMGAMLANLLQQRQQLQGATRETTTNESLPQHDFSFQLDQLASMGFVDREKCLRILQDVKGNINSALDRLFAEM